MRLRIIIGLLLFAACANAQLLRPQQSMLVVGAGESNEPGYGQNYFLSAAEKAQRRLRIYHVETIKFDRLHVAAANNYATFDTSHGFEVQIANALDSGYFGDYNLYYTKTGQGSTRVHNWMPGTDLNDRMKERLDASLALIYDERGVVPTIWNVWTLGINDMFAGLSAANFKDSINIVLDTLHTLYPTMKFIFTKFNQPSYTGYNSTFDALASERSSYVFVVYDASAGLRTDDTHWDYLGNKAMGRKITEVIQSQL